MIVFDACFSYFSHLFHCINESNLILFILGSPKGCLWQKPGKWLIFNCHDLKVVAIDMRDNQGFSHINEIY